MTDEIAFNFARSLTSDPALMASAAALWGSGKAIRFVNGADELLFLNCNRRMSHSSPHSHLNPISHFVESRTSDTFSGQFLWCSTMASKTFFRLFGSQIMQDHTSVPEAGVEPALSEDARSERASSASSPTRAGNSYCWNVKSSVGLHTLNRQKLQERETANSWTKEGCRVFGTVDDLLRAVIGYVHGTGHHVIPHTFDGHHPLVESGGFANPEYGTVYYGFRAPATGKRWAISNWKLIHRHSVDPNDHWENDNPPDESDFNFVAVAMCTLKGQRCLAQMARGKKLDRLLAMRKVMEVI
jgi:hypothetical protein